MRENAERAAQLVPESIPAYYRGPTTAAIAAALDEAEERGRRSVGLGDFVVTHCDEEARAPTDYFADAYGPWLACSRREGHDGEHEHEDSGFTWSAR